MGLKRTTLAFAAAAASVTSGNGQAPPAAPPAAAGLAGSIVQGKVVDHAGRPVAQATVWLQLRPPKGEGPRPKPFHTWARTAADGGYQFAGVPAGRFAICVQAPQGEWLDPCDWERTPPAAEVGEGQAGKAVAVAPVTLRRGFALRVRVDDPTGGLARKDPKKPTPLPAVLGVWAAGGRFLPLALRHEDPYGQEYEARVPYDTPLRVAVRGPKLALAAAGGALLDRVAGASLPLTVRPGKEPAMLRFTVRNVQLAGR